MRWRGWWRAAAQLLAGALVQSLLTAELTARWQGRWAPALDVASALAVLGLAASLAWRWRRGRLRGPIVLDGAPGLLLLAFLALAGGAAGATAAPELRAQPRSDGVGR